MFKSGKEQAMKTRIIGGLTLLVLITYMAGCETKAGTGAAVGAGGGALAGQAIGRNTEGTLIGAGVGAVGGYLIGNEMDKSESRNQQALAVEQANTRIIDVPNSNGSITPVTIRRVGGYWVGPRGEQYSTLPTADQLKPVYGF